MKLIAGISEGIFRRLNRKCRQYLKFIVHNFHNILLKINYNTSESIK
jgi:hypothetical protein